MVVALLTWSSTRELSGSTTTTMEHCGSALTPLDRRSYWVANGNSKYTSNLPLSSFRTTIVLPIQNGAKHSSLLRFQLKALTFSFPKAVGDRCDRCVDMVDCRGF